MSEMKKILLAAVLGIFLGIGAVLLSGYALSSGKQSSPKRSNA